MPARLGVEWVKTKQNSRQAPGNRGLGYGFTVAGQAGIGREANKQDFLSSVSL
jgi:hypothetical protein